MLITDTETLNKYGQLLLADYLWTLSTDMFNMRPPTFTNGKKFRGKLAPPDPPKNLVTDKKP